MFENITNTNISSSGSKTTKSRRRKKEQANSETAARESRWEGEWLFTDPLRLLVQGIFADANLIPGNVLAIGKEGSVTENDQPSVATPQTDANDGKDIASLVQSS